ncbi:cytochrome P450 [Lentzea sp. HUAS12]|uniref:cytochrome P450 n=1 Tax=Lentzea sp. HUAS12 TaxID=2951806 RepID=UPI00209FF143|nr:cytochrome P450 [Lentzea sp. HUAS12]USX53994.1 cytochrome P450 [Lentzea sp. HUAS12]
MSAPNFPPPDYARFREQPGLTRITLPGGAPVWLVSRHEDVKAVLTDPRISSNPAHPGFPNPGRTGGVPSQSDVPGWFVGLDAPEHTRFRKTLLPEFTVRRIKEMRPSIQRIVDGLIDSMLAAGGTADLVSAFALPVPSLVITDLLGVPYSDHEFFEAKTRTLVTISSTDEERDAAGKEILRYLGRLITVKRKRPGDDLTTRLIHAGTITPEELAGVTMLLLIAGHETTANNIALGVVTLLANPRWIGDDRVTEELLRLHSVADIVALRTAVEDVEIAGQLIKAGEGVIPLLAGANHDPGAFSCPAEFKPDRAERHHVAFGYGAHLCLGHNLVRAEMEIAFRSLFERIPSLRLAVPVEELSFKYDRVLFGLHALPVRW